MAAILAGAVLLSPASDAVAGSEESPYGVRNFGGGAGFTWGSLFEFRHGDTNAEDYIQISELESYTSVNVKAGQEQAMVYLYKTNPDFEEFNEKLKRVSDNPHMTFTIFWTSSNEVIRVRVAGDSRYIP